MHLVTDGRHNWLGSKPRLTRDENRVLICGRIASPPDLHTFNSGTRKLRLLVTTRADEPRKRIDVVPVNIWDPDDELLEGGLGVGARVLIHGAVQRSFWDSPEGRVSRLEVVGHHVALLPAPEPTDGTRV